MEKDWAMFDEYLPSPNKTPQPVSDDVCPHCHIDMRYHINDGSMVCMECGLATMPCFECVTKMDDTGGRIKKRVVYRRRNKFMAKLTEIQGLNTPPSHVIDAIREFKPTTIFEVRTALKYAKLTQYNGHCYSLLTELTGVVHFKFRISVVCDFISDFAKIEWAFKRKIGARNIIGYNFLIRKILEHRGYNTCGKLFMERIPSTAAKNNRLWGMIDPFQK